MKFISFKHNKEEKFGIVNNQVITDLTNKIKGAKTLKDLIANKGIPEAKKFATENSGNINLDEIEYMPLIPNPGKIICVGLNYSEHVKTEDALKHIIGYSCYNESTIREWQRHTRQFGMGKNFEKTGSFGPHMVLAEDIKNYKNLTLETRLNGEVMQNAKLSQLIFDIPILISYVSKAMAWRAGDVLVTGTPGGVGFKRNPPIFMKPGDKVEVEITDIGVLSNTIKDEII